MDKVFVKFETDSITKTSELSYAEAVFVTSRLAIQKNKMGHLFKQFY